MNIIHPTSIIGPNVTLGCNNVVGPNSILIGPLEIGDSNWIGPNVVIGTPPQVRDWKHPSDWSEKNERGGISIGSRNVIREFVTIHSPTMGATSVGNDCFLMSYVHVPHDCKIGNMVTIANSTQIAGHSIIQDFVTIGLSVNIHQFSVIGYGAMVGMGSVVKKNIPPLSLAYGNPAKLIGANKNGMKKLKYTDNEIESIDQFIKNEIYKSNFEFKEDFYLNLLNSWSNEIAKLKIR